MLGQFKINKKKIIFSCTLQFSLCILFFFLCTQIWYIYCTLFYKLRCRSPWYKDGNIEIEILDNVDNSLNDESSKHLQHRQNLHRPICRVIKSLDLFLMTSLYYWMKTKYLTFVHTNRKQLIPTIKQIRNRKTEVKPLKKLCIQNFITNIY